MVGGAGYMAGKKMSGGQQQQQQPAAPEQQQPAPPAASAPVASETERIEALTKLKSLLDSGVLTQEQFDAERQKLLQGM